MEQKLEINGKEYTFTANRKAACILASMQNATANENEDMLDIMFYALLKKEHNLSRQEVSALLDEAEKEYGAVQLLQFATELTNDVFTQAEETKFKKIEFLNRKNK